MEVNKMKFSDINIFIYRFDDWPSYQIYIDNLFETMGCDEDTKKKRILDLIDGFTNKILIAHFHPDPPRTKTYKEICDAIAGNRKLSKNGTYQTRRQFYREKQEEDETVNCWMERLVNMAVECNFRENYEEILLDRFVSGMKESYALRKICEEDSDGLTLRKAQRIAMDAEAMDVFRKG